MTPPGRTHPPRTTSTPTSTNAPPGPPPGVLRYLALALNCVATTDGQTICAPTHGGLGVPFHMEGFIRAGGTLYLLADPARIDRARPLLSLFAAEMFLAAERVALTEPGKRLRRPFIAVLDELRYGITVPNLPYVASSQRKHGIGFAYAVQSSTQEDAVYRADAPALRDAAGVTIVGGIDITLATELSDRAGTTTVVTATRATGNRSEHTEQQPALTIADQQALDDGDAVVYARGLSPFIGHAKSIYQQRRLLRRITAETRQVTDEVAAANTIQQAAFGLHTQATATGFDHTQHTGGHR
jgi:type IV secretory pathway TraG/TraD family ATPase VirD4